MFLLSLWGRVRPPRREEKGPKKGQVILPHRKQEDHKGWQKSRQAITKSDGQKLLMQLQISPDPQQKSLSVAERSHVGSQRVKWGWIGGALGLLILGGILLLLIQSLKFQGGNMDMKIDVQLGTRSNKAVH